jgi:hypothetical protein
MNKQFRRLLLAGVCAWIVAPAAFADDGPPPSHRPLDFDFGSLSHAEGLLEQRLRRKQDLQKFQDLVQPLLKDKKFLEMLKDVKPDDIEKLQESIKNNPGMLDNPTLRSLLNEAEEFKQTDGSLLSQDKRNELAQRVTGLLGQQKQSDASSTNPVKEGSPDLTHPPADDLMRIPEPPPQVVAKSDALHREFMQGMANALKDFNQSAEGNALRKAALNDLDKLDSGPSSSSPALSDFLEKMISPRQANWLSHNLKLPSLPNFDGLSSNPSLSGGSSGGGPSSGGGLDAMVWVIALGLFGVAAALALRAAKWQAGGGAKAWSAGPWPVHPSRVSTREDLIRAFEHLAFLRLGLRARPLNHIDLAGRLGDTGDRAESAARLAQLYEQARYAPPDELLPADELAAARGDLSTLAGAAA